MPIDAQATNSLFRASGVTDECPSCGKTGWRYAKEKVSLPYDQNPETAQSTGSSLHAIPIICNNCGLIRLFLDKED